MNLTQSWRDASRRVKTSVVAAAAVLAVGGGLALTLGSGPSAPADPPATSSGYAVQAPEDGDLRVAEEKIAQLAGDCQDDGACRYVPQQPGKRPAVVAIAAGTKWVPMTSRESTAFSVSAYTPKDPDSKVSFGYARGRLLLDQAPVGEHVVAVTGNQGGVWQFTVTVGD